MDKRRTTPLLSRDAGLYSVAEYEDGWVVEMPDPVAPLEDCKFLQVAGPYKREATAERWIKKQIERAQS